MKRAKNSEELAKLTPESGIGFVPTMGALHEGHLNLVGESVSRGLFTVVSIFVNPTQFNNPEDFERYPVDLEEDCRKLERAGCDVVFIPDVSEIYPSKKEEEPRYLHQFGDLEKRFEGEFRPGHFQGVAQVVHILFEKVQPTVAFFGEKDFQQLAVVRALAQKIMPELEIVAVDTKRETDGLAMSSRNRRLDKEQRSSAVLLYRSLMHARENNHQTTNAIQSQVESWFEEDPLLELEYFDIVDERSFQPLDRPADSDAPRALIAAFAGDVRLIDNMSLK